MLVLVLVVQDIADSDHHDAAIAELFRVVPNEEKNVTICDI